MVIPPIPLLLPSPEEKKPPAKRIEGSICYLPKFQNLTTAYLEMLFHAACLPSSGQQVELPFKM